MVSKIRVARALTAAIALSFTLSLPSPAYAKVSTADVVLGKTAQERGIDASELPDLSAKHALVMDVDGTAYFERDADATIKIASVTKVMTALVALENAELSDVVTVDRTAATVGESSLGLKEGDTLTMEEALTGLMVMSGNDVATAIANTVGKELASDGEEPYDAFISAMNKRAEEIGCKNTVYENAHGLDFDGWEGNMHSTAREALMIFAEAMKNDTFRKIDNSDQDAIVVTSADGGERQLDLIMRNDIHGQGGNIGGKTGSTYEAGDCFVSAFEREGGGEIYVAVFNAPDNDTRFADTLALADWYYGHLAAVPFANTPSMRGDVPAVAEATCSDWSDKTACVTVADLAKTVQVFSLAGELEQTVDLKTLGGSVEKGDAAGSITLSQAGKEVGSMELVAAEAVAGTNPFEWVMVQFDRVVRFFEGKPSMAESSVLNEAPNPLEFDSWGAAA